MRTLNFLLIIALFTPSFAIAKDYAVSLGSDCEPCGIIAKGKEAWNPKEFWTAKIKEINGFVEKEKTDYRLSMIERRRDKINQRLDDEEIKAMGINPAQFSNPEADRYLAKVDRELLQIEREILNEAIQWGRKCTAHAKRKLSQLYLIETQANAEVMDTEKHTQADGYHSAKAEDFTSIIKKYGKEMAIKMVADEFNKNCPMILDKYTLITKALPFSDRLKYQAVISGIPYDNIKQSLESLKNNIINIGTNTMCSSPDSRSLIDSGLIVEYEYYYEDDTFLFSYGVKKSDCLSIF